MKKIIACVLMAVVLVHAGCKKEKDKPPKETVVYAAGVDNSGILSKAVYWRNGTKFTLPDNGLGSSANSVFVDAKGDVYISGAARKSVGTSSVYIACYWKNGQRTDLDVPQTGPSNAYDIYVENGVVYCSGNYRVSPVSTLTGCIWKNNTRSDMAGAGPDFGWSMVVSSGETYVTDYRGYWKGTSKVQLSSGAAFSFDIFKAGADVIVAGREDDVPCYWKNGAPTKLESVTGGFAYAIAGHKGDVYCVGETAADRGVVWKNTASSNVEIHPAGAATSACESILFFEDKMYTGGYARIGGQMRSFIFSEGNYTLLPGEECILGEIAVTKE